MPEPPQDTNEDTARANRNARIYRLLTQVLSRFLELLSRIDARTLPAPAGEEMARLVDLVRAMHTKYSAFLDRRRNRPYHRSNNRNEGLG